MQPRQAGSGECSPSAVWRFSGEPVLISECGNKKEKAMKNIKRVLVSGFEPFGVLERNNSEDTVALLPDRAGGIEIKKIVLPVEYNRCAELLLEQARKWQADAIVCTGVAERRSAVCLEYVAINVMDCAQPDNAGRVALGDVIEEEADAVLYTSLPVEKMLRAVINTGIPASVSFDAGTYVCNNLFYKLMYEIKYSSVCKCGGFIHLPPAREISPDRLALALSEAIKVGFSDDD